MSDAFVVNGIVQSVGTFTGVLPAIVTRVPITASTGPAQRGYTWNGTIFTPGLPPEVVAANTLATNTLTVKQQVANALTRLRQIETQANAFQAQAPYAVANLANLNDLLSKSQLIAAAVHDIAADLVGVARILSNNFDGTT